MRHFAPGDPVTLVGSVTLDTNIAHGIERRKIGGSVTYSGITFRKLGVEAAVVTSVAEEDRAILSLFRESGIHVHAASAEHTTEFVNMVDGDDRVQRMPHAGRMISVRDAESAFASTKFVYLGPLFPSDIADDVLDFIARRRIRAVVDLQGYLRDVVDGVVRPRGHAMLERLLSVVQRAKVGHQELAVLEQYFGRTAPEIVARFGLEELVATAGRAGGRVYSASGEQMEYSAVIASAELDTTGAGDVFFAAYCVHRDWHGGSVQDACRAAAAIASQHVAGEFVAPDTLALMNYRKAERNVF